MIFTTLLSSALFASARTIEYETLVGNFTKYDSGLYQSALDAATNRLYVTSSLNRQPFNHSDLLAVDPATLHVLQDVSPPVADSKTGGLFSVYGMSLDQTHGRIWVTHARQKSVGYFNTEGLTIGNEWPIDTEIGAREVWADEKTGLAYVGSSMNDCVYVYSPEKKDGPVQLINITEKTGHKFFRVMAFSADKEKRILYTASLVSNLVAAINLDDYSVKTYPLGDVKNPSGVALDTKRKYLYVSNQRSNNTVVLDTNTGNIIKAINGLGGPLSTAYDAKNDVVYIACRTASKVVVIDAADFSQITELKVGTPNHISVGPNGEIYVTDKSKDSDLYKFTPVDHNKAAASSGFLSQVASASAQHSQGHPASANAAAHGSQSQHAASGAPRSAQTSPAHGAAPSGVRNGPVSQAQHGGAISSGAHGAAPSGSAVNSAGPHSAGQSAGARGPSRAAPSGATGQPPVGRASATASHSGPGNTIGVSNGARMNLGSGIGGLLVAGLVLLI